MEPRRGGGPPPRSPAPKADTLSLALCFLLLGPPHCALAVSRCREEEYPVGTQCCPKCNPGYRVKRACGERTSTLCTPCTPGTYTAHFNGLSECLQCRVCDPAMDLVTRRPCSPTENTVCSCDRGHFCVAEAGGDCAECRPHSTCRPGQRVQDRGTEWQDTVCADCPLGTFSPNGTLAECRPWTNCSGAWQVEVSPGTSSADARCSWNPKLWLFVIFSVILLVLGLLCFGIRARVVAGLTERRVFRQCQGQQAEVDNAAVPALRASQILPDVTTVAVEETEPMRPLQGPAS